MPKTYRDLVEERVRTIIDFAQPFCDRSLVVSAKISMLGAATTDPVFGYVYANLLPLEADIGEVDDDGNVVVGKMAELAAADPGMFALFHEADKDEQTIIVKHVLALIYFVQCIMESK